MDTKSKNSNECEELEKRVKNSNKGGKMNANTKNSNELKKVIYGFCWLLLLVAMSATALAISAYIALEEMEWINEIDWSIEFEEYGYYDMYLAGEITNMVQFREMTRLSVIGTIGGILVSLALLFAVSVMIGRYSKDAEGNYKLNWFDKIWSEVHFGGGVAAVAGAIALIMEFRFMWLTSKPFGFWTWYNAADYNPYYSQEIIELPGMIIAEVGLIFVTLLCYRALIKKFKAGELWEESLLGGAWFAIVRAIKGSDKTLLKVLALLITGCLLCATWIGLPVCIVLVLVFMPKIVKEFNDIKVGVEEVKNGNLTYKIPVARDAKGITGEFGRLAANINEISSASNLAIQNELKSQRLKTELISNVSHDLKTPLTSMVSYIDLMKKEGLDSENAPEYLDILDQKTQRLKALTENLFEAAKASSGAIPVNMEAIDISSLLTQSLVEMEERLAAKNLQVQVKNDLLVGAGAGVAQGSGDTAGGFGGSASNSMASPQHEAVKIKADGQLMWRVIENLLGNVSKYALEGSRVYINVSEQKVGDGSMIRLDVKNISAEQLNISADELMERFKRGDESRNTEGSGLGLAIAKDLIKMMNGIFEITIDGDLFKATVMMEKAVRLAPN